MATGWQCDECKRWFYGQYGRRIVIGDPAADPTFLNLSVYHRPDGGKFEPDLCSDCARKIAGPILRAWLEEADDGD